jgi:hypothetical protein
LVKNPEIWIDIFESPALTAERQHFVPAEGVNVPDYISPGAGCEVRVKKAAAAVFACYDSPPW